MSPATALHPKGNTIISWNALLAPKLSPEQQRSICPHDPETNNPNAKQRLLCKEAIQLQNDASKHARSSKYASILKSEF
jgi:hypothetical protein